MLDNFKRTAHHFLRFTPKDEDEEIVPEPAGESAEEIMDAIIALDDRYRAGELPDAAYQERRRELKARLRKKVGNG
jgi:hypothetical protein